MDISKVIVPKSDQVNADDLLAASMTITITGVTVRAGEDQPVSISFEGSKKVYRPCKSMCRVMVSAWGADSSKYVGRSLTIYCDPQVKWGGMEVGGIRISHMSHIDGKMTMALTVTRANKKPFTVLPMAAQNALAAQGTASPSGVESTEPAPSNAPTDAEIVNDIEAWVKKKKFDMAFDLLRAINDQALKDSTRLRIEKAKAYVENRSSAPHGSTGIAVTAPSQEGVGQGAYAGADDPNWRTGDVPPLEP